MLGFVIESSKKYFQGKSFACFSGILEDGSNFVWYQEISDIFGFIKTELSDHEKHPTFKSLWNDFVKIAPFPNHYGRDSVEQKSKQMTIFENNINHPSLWLAQHVGVSLDFLSPPKSIQNNVQIFINPKVRDSNYIPAISTISIDIEVGMKSHDILDVSKNLLYCIAIHSNFQSTVLMLHEKNPSPTTTHLKEFTYKTFPNERLLLQEFIRLIAADPNHIFLGWNILKFDLHFLCKKIQRYDLPIHLGILGRKSTFFVSGNKDFRLFLGGRSILDGIWLLKDLQIKLPNYKLDTAAKLLVQQQKTITSTNLQKLEEIDYLFENDKESLAIYNFQDAVLPTKILEKVDGLSFLISKSILSKTPCSHLGSLQVLLDSMYIPILKKFNFVAPEVLFKPKKKSSQSSDVIFSQDFQTKPIHKNIFQIDCEDLDLFIVKNFPIDILSKTQAQYSHSQNNILQISENIFLRKDSSVSFEIASHWKKVVKNLPIWWKEKKSVSQSLESLYKNLLHSITSPYSRYHTGSLLTCIQKIKSDILNQMIKKIQQQKDITILLFRENFVIAAYPESYSEESIKRTVSKIFSSIKKDLSEIYMLDIAELQRKISFFSHFFTLNTAKSEKYKSPFSYAVQDFSGNILFYPFFEKMSIDLPQEICMNFLKNLFKHISLENSLQEISQKLYSGDLDEHLIYTQKLGKEYEKYYLKNETTIPHYVTAGKKLGLIKTGSIIKYVLTTSGAEPHNQVQHELDYKYYEEKYVLPLYKILRTTLENEHSTPTHQQMGFFDSIN